MKTLKFKTNVKCEGCLAAVKPFLEESKEINHWEIDLTSPDKILTVQAETIDSEQVCEIVHKAGFNAAEIKPEEVKQ
jgi:copper chaperone CopZ